MAKNIKLTKISSFGPMTTTTNSFFFNQFYSLSSKNSLDGNIKLIFELLIIEINLDITQDKEKYSKSNIHTNISQ